MLKIQINMKKKKSILLNYNKSKKKINLSSHRINARQKTRLKVETLLNNPFESRENKRQKHDILNRISKGSKRNVALSRRLAYEKRKRYLLNDIKHSSKANKFKDNRFGEKNLKMSEEERILERFKRLRNKRSLYNLEDTSELMNSNNDMKMTHLGQTLSTKDDPVDDTTILNEFQQIIHGEEINESDLFDETIDAQELLEQIKKIGRTQKFDEKGNEIKKSKKEVMEEVIAKAKLFKMQRQKDREIDEEERIDLDEQFSNLLKVGAFNFRSSKKKLQENELKSVSEEHNIPNFQKEKENVSDSDNDYEKIFKGLANENKAAASDRTLTSEEIAKRALDKLEWQQKELEQRMKGISHNEDFNNDNFLSKYQKRRKKNDPKFLDSSIEQDSFFSEQNDYFTEDSIENEYSYDENEPIDTSTKEASTDSTNNNMEKLKINEVHTDRRVEMINAAKSELPFIISLPLSHKSFVQLFIKYPSAEFPKVISRLRQSNSIHLKEENRQLMSSFLITLLNHLAYIVESRADNDLIKHMNFKDNDVVDCLSAIYDISHDIPRQASIIFSERLNRMQRRLKKQLDAASLYVDTLGGDYGCKMTRLELPGESFSKNANLKVSLII